MSNRTVSNALMQTAVVVEQLKIKRDEFVNITIDRWGVCRAHLTPDGFVRIIRKLAIEPSKVEVSFDREGDLHAEFDSLGTKFITCILRSKPEYAEIAEALSRLATDRTAQKPLRIKGGQQLLLT